MTNQNKPRDQRSKTWLIIALAAAVGLIAGGIVLAVVINRDGNPGTAEPLPTPPSNTITTTTSSPAASEPPPGGRTADWCLGGADPFESILVAQSQAPLTDEGAASFVAAVTKWVATYPIDPAAPEVITQISTPDGLFSKTGLNGLNETARELRSQEYTQAVVLRENAGYRVISNFTAPDGSNGAARVQVSLTRQLTKNNGATETINMTSELSLEVIAGRWTLRGSGEILGDPDDPTFGPWIPYSGDC